jgi:hypothetical protein
MNMRLICKFGITSGMLMALAGTVYGSPITFFGEDLNGNPAAVITHPNSDAARNSFFSNLVGVGTETFEGITPGTAPPLPITFPGAGTATLTGSGGSVNSLTPGTTNGAGRFAISGSNYFEVSISDFAINFSAPIAAFGFYGTDIGDFGGALTLTLTETGGGTVTLPVNNLLGSGTGSLEDGSVLYFGFYDTTQTYTSIAFNNNAAGTDFFGFDDFSVGSLQQVQPSVPEPSSLIGLVGFGLIGFAALRQRKAR